MYIPSMQGKTYAKRKYEGIGFPTVSERSTEREALRNQFAGAGYCTKRKVINLQAHGIVPHPKITKHERFPSSRSGNGSTV